MQDVIEYLQQYRDKVKIDTNVHAQEGNRQIKYKLRVEELSI
jgi:hypothetical protein